MKDGAISNLKLLEAEDVLPILGNDETAQSIQETIRQAREIQRKCSHKGWARSDNLYLECGDCGAPLKKVWGEQTCLSF